MSRTIPVALQAILDQPATTMCGLLRVKPRGEAAFGLCSTNRAITYNDGDGSIVYKVMTGYDASAIVSTSDTAVDNAEARGLLLSGGDITEAKINAGVYDGAEFSIYALDYTDLDAGHKVVQHGYFGRAKASKGASFTVELRSLIDLLRQEPWEKWQIRCRVRQFGSQPGQERFPCRYVIDGEWINDVAVTSVGAESDRTFTASGLAQVADYFAPGILTFTTGPNAGISLEVESFGVGGIISLTFPTPYPIAAAHEFDIRRECSRNWSGHNSCLTFNNRINYRGEPKIQPAEALAGQIPGAQASPGSGGETFQPAFDEE